MWKIPAVLFVALNALMTTLVIREHRSLAAYCRHYRGPAWDNCLEPYNYLYIELLIGIWIVVGGCLAVVTVVTAVRERRRTFPTRP